MQKKIKYMNVIIKLTKFCEEHTATKTKLAMTPFVMNIIIIIIFKYYISVLVLFKIVL